MKTITTIILLLLILSPVTVGAQGSGPFGNGLGNIKEQVREKAGDLVEERGEQVRVRLLKHRQAVVERVCNNIFNMFDRVTERFNSVSNRLSEKIEELEKENVDLKEASSILLKANEQFEDLKNLISSSEEEIKESITGEFEKDLIRERAVQIREAVRNLKTTYRAVVEEIRIAVVSEVTNNE